MGLCKNKLTYTFLVFKIGKFGIIFILKIMEVYKVKDIIILDIDYQSEVKKCKIMEDIVGKSGLMQKLFKDIIQQLLEAEMEEHYR